MVGESSGGQARDGTGGRPELHRSRGCPDCGRRYLGEDGRALRCTFELLNSQKHVERQVLVAGM